ncbi:MAG TPA: radical SAM protein [Steroidobacteraceae bacterium]|nr:radical SAM protein [Steroidobacteraceae bacterium]
MSCPLGAAAEDYRAPLLIAWQLTNRCAGRCLACCEESGPDRGWADELTREQALALAREIAAAGIPYVVFGGGEPLGVPHAFELLETLSAAGVALKLETDGRHIDAAAAERLAALSVHCIQISVDGATAATHERVRPGSSFSNTVAAIERLISRGRPPQMVFAPTRLNLHEAVAAFELAVSLGCQAFVTGPLMRLGRAAADWDRLACTEADWERTVQLLRARARELAAATALAIYPWDIVGEMERRRECPQAMLLIVPNGKVKLLNALPFAVADLRAQSLAYAWRAYRSAWGSSEVARFIDACRADPTLLRHANETWPFDPQLPG